MVIELNKERVTRYLEVWLKYIRKEEIEELEQDINMPLIPFLVDILNNLYNKYSQVITYISATQDPYNYYIIAPTNGYYSLEDFLLNRLLRSITGLQYQDESNTFMPDSHYAHEFGEVSIDKNRVKQDIKEIKCRRKLVAHEFLHGLKTQFYNGDFFTADRYYQMKEELKRTFGSEINDFPPLRNQLNDLYKHCGLSYSSRIIKRYLYQYSNLDLINLDEILNESEAITASKDDYKVLHQLANNIFMALQNPESSNTFITNYAFIIERLIDTKTLFIGLYLEPEVFYQKFNYLYTPIFQHNYGINSSALYILTYQLDMIKKNPQDINLHIKLLNTLYECIDIGYTMYGYNNQVRAKTIGCIGNKGLLEIVNRRLQPLPNLRYSTEYEIIRNKTK